MVRWRCLPRWQHSSLHGQIKNPVRVKAQLDRIPDRRQPRIVTARALDFTIPPSSHSLVPSASISVPPQSWIPLSMTGSIMSVTTGCMKLAKTISDLREKYKNAHTTLSAMCVESTVICASLSQTQSLILRRPDAIRAQLAEPPELVATSP